MSSVRVSPLLVCEQCVRLQPGSDTKALWKFVVGAGILELSNLRENVKLLKQREMKWNARQFLKQKEWQHTKVEHVSGHCYETPPGGDTYPSALLKVDESALWKRKNFIGIINLLKYHNKTAVLEDMTCSHLHGVRQCCVQHGEDSQVRAQVRHDTTAEALRAHSKPHVDI